VTSPRFAFLDGLRALAILLMVVNHTARWWIGVPMGPARYRLVYASMLLAAPIFLLLVGFVLPLSTAARAPGGRGAGLRHALRRGGQLLLAGWLLNVLVFPHDPWRLSGVLHTIGLGVVGGALALPLARTPRGRALLVAVAAALYATFVAAFPALAGWAARHPGAAPVVFGDFPPWPWLGLVALGLALGGRWAEVAADAAARGRHLRRLALAGAALLAVFGAHEARAGGPHLTFARDFVLDHHWTPAPSMLLGIVGALLVLLPAGWCLLDAAGRRPRWLLDLGRAAMMLYVVHQVLIYSLARNLLGLAFHGWAAYAAANVVLVGVLIALARLWLAVRPRLGPHAPAAAAA
jgi:peptidoglycan/LPS O-acetylase OafA/YrhL